ncbi:hypothetical protein ACFFMN_33165 [Planobispora siamensis]|uniref:Uncharacterized protein n=1 Tax=Planobispora siamensis TaxID=936338 RepID=A0A8J3WKB7_9ACTN|nr:hypothetical protein [Planobispora siamensis]GIH92583.1 hypothetical protein Psi01_32130 [Planobispora siamensis]
MRTKEIGTEAADPAEAWESRVAWTARCAIEVACLLATLVVVYVVSR